MSRASKQGALPRVVSLLPEKRFRDAGVALPEGLAVVFAEARTEEEIIAAGRGAEMLLVPAVYPAVTARVIENLPAVRLIQSAGAGFDKIDLQAAARLGIPVANAPGGNAAAVAEFALALLVALQRRLILCDREVKAGRFAAVRERVFTAGLGEVRGTRLGIVGLGAIGRELARLAGLLGARLAYFDVKRLTAKEEARLGVTWLPFAELLSGSDAVSLHLPLTEATRRLIDAEALARMPPGALLINTARGELVDASALAAALESGRLGGAALDTLSPEPPPADHPLLKLSEAAAERLILTPHIAGTTRGAFARMLAAALANLLRVAAGGTPENVVNGVAAPRVPR
jgi:phosphoglycerate dehydrogenase-like enzyme